MALGMKFFVVSICLLGTSLGVPLEKANGKASFKGHKLFSVIAKDASQVELLRQLEMNDVELDFWNEPTVGRKTDFRVQPRDLARVKATLKRANIDWKIINEDIQESIDDEARSLQAVRDFTRNTRNFQTQYLSFSEIGTVLKDFETNYNSRVTLSVYGNSYNGNPLYQVKVSKNDGKVRPAVWVESLTHAREWITGSVALYTIEELAKAEGSSRAAEMLESFDWYFSPVHNPDGYMYTWTNNRLWRKNRRINSMFCSGVDLNRNWDAHWMEAGTSSNPCSDTYGGTGPSSESETSYLRDAVANTPNVIAFFSFHAYSELLLLPYAHGQYSPSNLPQLRTMADEAMKEQTKIGGRAYQVGVPKDILYAASGGAYDYMMIGQSIPYAFTYELRPDGNTSNGFVLPADQILPTCQEAFASLWSFSRQISEAVTQK